jgi:hypothetical protein
MWSKCSEVHFGGLVQTLNEVSMFHILVDKKLSLSQKFSATICLMLLFYTSAFELMF